MTCEGCGPLCPSCGEKMDEHDKGYVCEDCGALVVIVIDDVKGTTGGRSNTDIKQT